MTNYYEMLGLPCDGDQAKNVKLIERMINQWKSEKEVALSNTTKEADRQKIRDEMNEEGNMRRLQSDAAFRMEQAEEAKAIRIGQVQSIIQIMDKNRTTEKRIAQARISRIAVIIGLLPITVKKKFTDNEYTVVESPNVSTNSFIMEKRVLERINGNFQLIQKHMRENPHEPRQEIAQAKNLYEYIAIMHGGSIDKAGEYRSKATNELKGIFDAMMAQHTGNTAPRMWYRDIESNAKTDVCGDNTKRAKYDNALKLQEIDSFCQLLTTVPVSVKLERAFADGCIREIQRAFPDEAQAIAIYNKYGNMPPDSLYEKENTSIATMCTCHILNFHDTKEQAERAKCVSCGRPLYEECPSCHTKIPATSDFCSCGFSMRGRQLFALHKERFERAVTAADLPKAQEELAQAKVCDPANADLTAMERKLSTLRQELGRPIEEIRNALQTGMVNEAQRRVAALKARRPDANVAEYQRQISDALAWAAGKYEMLERTVDQGRAVAMAFEIVEKVKDHEQALHWLRKHPPRPVLKVKEVSDTAALHCVIQWTDDPGNAYVSYTVVRKEGARPQNIQDGTRIASGLTSCQYRDEHLSPGKMYAYAVFAVRGDAASPPTHSQLVCLMQNIRDVQVNISAAACTLSWQDVAGSLGVHIRRSADGGKNYTVICKCAKGSFSDQCVQNNTQYKYSLRTVWQLQGERYLSPEAEELIRDVRVEEKPPRTDIELVHVGPDGLCQLRWEAGGGGTICLVALKAGRTVVADQVYGWDMIREMGDIVVQGASVAARECTWYAGLGRQYRVVAMRSFGSDLVGGQTITISTVPALKVDENTTTIMNNTLSLHLTDVPGQVNRILYHVSMNGSVCTEQMAMQGILPFVDISTFRRTGAITVENLQQENLTVSLLAMYGTGATAYYSPVSKFEISNLPKRRVEYWLEWQRRGFSRKRVRTGAKLHVKVEGDRLPEMELCCRDDGNMIFQYVRGGPGIVQLLRVEAAQAKDGSEVVFDIPERSMNGLPTDTCVHLFLSPREQNSFHLPVITDTSTQRMPAE